MRGASQHGHANPALSQPSHDHRGERGVSSLMTPMRQPSYYSADAHQCARCGGGGESSRCGPEYCRMATHLSVHLPGAQCFLWINLPRLVAA
jgi:hypothetical protein